ncbi:hypothetical protein ACOYR1_09025 [Thalassotalea piscium]
MRYHQLKEIYEHVIEINQELNGLYDFFLENTKDERTRIFLHYIIDKQAENILDLKKLSSDESVSVLDTWIDEDIEHKLSELINSFKQNTEVSFDLVLSATTEVRIQLTDWLQIIKDLVGSETVKTHVENLIEFQTLKSQQLVHSAHRMDDI